MDLPGGCVVAIGNFDGVHAGHRALLQQARGVAVARGVPLVVLTFEPHPYMVLRPGEAFRRLMGPAEKAEALAACGVDGVAVLGFDSAVAAWTPVRFVAFLKEWLAPATVCVGENFRFGARAAGDAAFLAEQGGFDVSVVPLARDAGGVISSTRLRERRG